MPLFYHYTDEERAQNIIRCGKIMVSLTFMANGDAAYGNGVYLTKLSALTSTREEIATNNWTNTSAQSIKKTNNYFVFDIPDLGVEDKTEGGRNIFKFGKKNDLRLTKYHLWLKNFDTGGVIASYKYQILSLGPASKARSNSMGNYIITEESVNGKPVYNGDNAYLFMSSSGNWIVGQVAGVNEGYIRQMGINFSLGPDANFFTRENNRQRGRTSKISSRNASRNNSGTSNSRTSSEECESMEVNGDKEDSSETEGDENGRKMAIKRLRYD